ncbi:uncharacterized protein LOC135106788 [Scylla paramamosain]|uniref:uncharacterized protein LOC135106788 n=1 Tax=Scylla paramamosain TaxID=85552 RepID=UPI003083D9F6
MESRQSNSSTNTAPSLPPSPTPPSSSSPSPSPPRNRKLACSLSSSLPPSPPSPETLADELYTLPLVSSIYEMVSAVHAKLSRVVPFFAIVSAWLTSVAAAVVRCFSQWRLVRILAVTVEKAMMWALGTARGKYQLRPEELAQRFVRRVRKEVVRATTSVASHPMGRLPWRVTLTATGRTCHFLETLKFDERQPCLGEVFIIGRLQQVYNRTITGLTVRLRTCHCALQGLQGPREDGTKDPDNCNKKRKHHDDNEDSLASGSCSDEDSVTNSKSVPGEDDVNRHTEDGAEETRKPPVAIKVTSYD